MATHVSGQAAAVTAAPTLHVGTYRRALLAVIINNDLFTPAEQLRANHSAYECQDAQRLALWTKNARRVAAEREAQQLASFAQAIERGEQSVQQVATQQPAATAEQCSEVHKLALHPALTAAEKAGALLRLPTLTYAEAIAFIGWLKLRTAYGPGVMGRKLETVTPRPAEQQAALATYVREPHTRQLVRRPVKDMRKVVLAFIQN